MAYGFVMFTSLGTKPTSNIHLSSFEGENRKVANPSSCFIMVSAGLIEVSPVQIGIDTDCEPPGSVVVLCTVAEPVVVVSVFGRKGPAIVVS